jgi:orotate phosphoribosyltransferase
MEKYKEEFIKFLIECDALRFGEFTLKSGRVAPYFINTGMFDNGSKIKKLGEFYAAAIKNKFNDNYDGLYGPAYKGIPLCITACIGLEKLGIEKGYVFNRKEAKKYADKSSLVGMKIAEDTSLVLVDDVITSGKAIRESLETLKINGNPKVKGIVISVNRMEKGKTEKNALKEVEEDLGIPIFSIVNLKEIIETLHNKEIDGKICLNDEMLKKINDYRKEYGAD